MTARKVIRLKMKSRQRLDLPAENLNKCGIPAVLYCKGQYSQSAVLFMAGVAERIRTSDLPLRRRPLYPTELQRQKNGAPERTRTSNHQNRNLLLYPLSYGHV